MTDYRKLPKAHPALQIRVAPEVRQQWLEAAERDGLKLNGWIRALIQQRIEEQKESCPLLGAAGQVSHASAEV